MADDFEKRLTELEGSIAKMESSANSTASIMSRKMGELKEQIKELCDIVAQEQSGLSRLTDRVDRLNETACNMLKRDETLAEEYIGVFEGPLNRIVDLLEQMATVQESGASD